MNENQQAVFHRLAADQYKHEAECLEAINRLLGKYRQSDDETMGVTMRHVRVLAETDDGVLDDVETLVGLFAKLGVQR